MTPEHAVLAVHDLSIAFGGVRAVDGVSFEVPARGIVSLIGPNGAGKTTCLNGISGFARARGSIRFGQVELVSQPAHRRSGLGIARTFQNAHVFADMTLLENVLVGQHAAIAGNILLDILRFPVAAREREAGREALATLERLGVAAQAHRPAGHLSYGSQKLAGIARALVARPRLLLLDEPAAGLSALEAASLGRMIADLRRDFDLAVLLVEHNMRLVMDVSDLVVVLHHGRKLAEGRPEEVGRNPAVIEAYLGSDDAPGEGAVHGEGSIRD